MAAKIPYGQRKCETLELRTEENGALLWIILNRSIVLSLLKINGKKSHLDFEVLTCIRLPSLLLLIV